jgi:hypothetical protein
VVVVLQFSVVILLHAQLSQPLPLELELFQHTAVLGVSGLLHTLLKLVLDALQ